MGYISDLNRLNPTNTESPSTWDNYIRETKEAIKSTFPNWVPNTGITDFKKLNALISVIRGTILGIKLYSVKYNKYAPTFDKKKNLYIFNPQPGNPQKAKLNAIGAVPPIGSFVESMLSPAEMLSAYPNDGSIIFMECNGQSCVGSYYWEIMGRPATLNVPNLTDGSFLRPARTEDKIGTKISDKTAVNKLSVAVSDNVHGVNDHLPETSHDHIYDNFGTTNELDIGGASPSNPKNAIDRTFVTVYTEPQKSCPTQSHIVTDHNFSINGGDDETAPNHLVTYVYLRVN